MKTCCRCGATTGKLAGDRNAGETGEYWCTDTFSCLHRQEETGYIAPPPKHTLRTDNGWLSPDGELYSCPFRGHITLADRIAKAKGLKSLAAGSDLENLGYIKLQSGEWWFATLDELSQRQVDTIHEWDAVHGSSSPPGARRAVKVCEV